MNLYLNYAKHRAGVAKYALEGLSNQVLAAEYRTALPSEETLAAELERTRKALEQRARRSLDSEE